MNYYPAWLEYLQWTLIAAGFLCGMTLLAKSAGRSRGYIKLASLLLIGLGIAVGGLAGLLFNSNAAIVACDGVVRGLEVDTGKRSSTTTFYLREAPGVSLHMSQADPHIQNGQRVHVVYQAGSGALLNFEVSDRYGNYATLQTDSLFNSGFVILLGSAVALFGIIGRRYENVTPTLIDDPTERNEGAVDSASLLHLSDSD